VAVMKLIDCDVELAQMLKEELVKVRCWLTGYRSGSKGDGPPGEDGLRQLQVILDHSISAAKKDKDKK
jgi:hypothetical protein